MLNINRFFNKDKRSSKAFVNILVSGTFKFADTIVYFLLVPLTLGYVNPYEYGIWITLNSILTWVDSFDIGLGNGLRNKLTEALAKEDIQSARKYVSTTFFMLVGIILVVGTIGYVAISNIDWYTLLNVDSSAVGNLREIILVSFSFFALNFVLKFVGNIYQALQLPSAMYIMNFAGHTISLIVIYLLTLYAPGSLFLLAIVYSAAPPLVYAIAYPVTFNKLYKYLAPSINFFDKGCVKELFNLSMMFFAIQIASLVLFSLSSLLISNMFGPAEVTPYNIAQRYFSVIPMLCNIIIAPMWSATTDAYARGDIDWISRTQRKMIRLLFVTFVILLLMVCVSPIMYNLWIGEKVSIHWSITVLMALYNFIIMWSVAYSYFLNGMGKLKLQAINTVAVAICFYPLCRFLGSMYLVPGILMGMCLVNLSGAVLNTIQFKLVVSRKAVGIWNK